MELTEILSISGRPGLFKLLSNNGSRLIVESMNDGKRLPVSATAKISSLGDIAIFTLEEDVPLGEVFEKMREKTGGEAAPSHKSDPKELRAFLDSILSDLDHDRVYDSDLKKLFQWYNILLEKGVLEEIAAKAADANTEEETAESEANNGDS